MSEEISADEILSLVGISRATLTRWMDTAWINGKGFTGVFPAGKLRDGKTKVWNRLAVEKWLEENGHNLGRHPNTSSTTLSKADIETIRLALNYALIERESFVDATIGCGMDDAHERSKKLVKRFDALHKKLFGTPTDHTEDKRRMESQPTVTIFELSARPISDGSRDPE